MVLAIAGSTLPESMYTCSAWADLAVGLAGKPLYIVAQLAILDAVIPVDGDNTEGRK